MTFRLGLCSFSTTFLPILVVFCPVFSILVASESQAAVPAALTPLTGLIAAPAAFPSYKKRKIWMFP